MNSFIDPENSLAAAVAELNTYNQKRSSSFCDTYIFEPESERETPCGKLFVMIEIEENSKKASQVAEAIATIAQFEYYKNQHPGMVANFEAALAKVNEVLSEIAEHGEISWVGKIHAVIAAQAEHHLAVSQTGRVKTYLIRNTQPMEIGDETPASHKNAVRTFDSIATGDLYPRDHLIFTNKTLLNSLSLSRIESFLQNNPVLSGTRLVESSLDKTAAEPCCALVIKIDTAKAIAIENSKDEKYADLTPEELASEPATKKLQNAYDDIRSRNWAVKGLGVAKAAGHGLKVAGLFVGDLAQNIYEGVRGKVRAHKDDEPKTLTRLEKENDERLDEEAVSISSQDAPIQIREEIETLPSEAASVNEDPMAPLQKRFSRVNEDADLGVRPKKKFKISNIWVSTFSRVKNLPGTMKKMPRVSQVLLITSASLLIVFIVSIGIFSTNKAKEAKAAQYKSMLDQATSKYNSAVAALIYKNTTDANKLLADAEGLNGQVLGSSYFNSDAAALQQKIDEEKNRVLHINDLQGVTKLATLPESTTGVSMVTDGTSLFLAANNNKVYSMSAKGGKVQELIKNLSADGNIIKINYLSASHNLLLLTDRNSLVEYKSEAGVVSMINTVGFDKITDITSYGNRFIYLLQPSVNKILRETKGTSGFIAETSWIKESNASIAKGVSFAIDGSIYVLNSNGTIQKFLNGAHDDFTTPSLKTPMKTPTKIVTNENLKNVYILDPANKRIVITKKTGALLKELVSDQFSDTKDLVVDENKSTGYVISGNTVYSFPLALN